jgi:hypothetical protein
VENNPERPHYKKGQGHAYWGSSQDSFLVNFYFAFFLKIANVEKIFFL